jgi:hypothetical protein
MEEVMALSSAGIVFIFQALAQNSTLENLMLGRIQPGDDLHLAMQSLPVMTCLKRLTWIGEGANAWIQWLQNP